MANHVHLDELIQQQTDPVAKRLLEEFATLVRDPNIRASDYPIRLRQVMDELFKEASRAAA
jgi:hypothetical protein